VDRVGEDVAVIFAAFGASDDSSASRRRGSWPRPLGPRPSVAACRKSGCRPRGERSRRRGRRRLNQRSVYGVEPHDRFLGRSRARRLTSRSSCGVQRSRRSWVCRWVRGDIRLARGITHHRGDERTYRMIHARDSARCGWISERRLVDGIFHLPGMGTRGRRRHVQSSLGWRLFERR